MRVRTASVAPSAESRLSSQTRASDTPLIPPFRLTSSTAISIAFRIVRPTGARSPLRGSWTPILISSAARAGAPGIPATSRSEPPTKARRVIMAQTLLGLRRSRRVRPSPGPEPDHVERRHRLGEAFEREIAGRLSLDDVVDHPEDPLGHEDLARLRLAAQPSRQVGDRPERRVVPATFEPDRADGRVALGDAHSAVQVVAPLPPPRAQLCHAIPHRHRHPHRTLGGVRDRHRVVEENHHAVAGEPLQRALVLEDHPAHLAVVLAQHAHDLLRLGTPPSTGREGAPATPDSRVAASLLQSRPGRARAGSAERRALGRRAAAALLTASGRSTRSAAPPAARSPSTSLPKAGGRGCRGSSRSPRGRPRGLPEP